MLVASGKPNQAPMPTIRFFPVALLVLGCLGTVAQTDQELPIRGIAIYIDYPDSPPDISPEDLDGLLNGMEWQGEGISRSFRKYWHQETRRNWDIQHDIFYYTAPQPATYYQDLIWQDGIELYQEALEWVIANHPNYDWNALSRFTPEDPRNPCYPDVAAGSLKSVMIISSSTIPAGMGAAHFPNWTLSNDAVVHSVYSAGLQYPWMATQSLFVLAHESGHGIFDFPDTYDYGYDSGGTTIYSLMSGGGFDVEPVGAPFLAAKHWGHVIEPEPGLHTFTLRADGDSVVVVRNIHDPNEYFTIECRKQSTPGNSLIPVDLGLMVWHSDLKVHTSNNEQDMAPFAHYRHSIEQPDGLFEIEAMVDPVTNPGDFFLPGDSFTPQTVPSSNWWAGEASGLEITDVQLLDANHMAFTVNVPELPDDFYPFVPNELWSSTTATPWQTGYGPEQAWDNDSTTYYHVPWGSGEPRPHTFEVDLGAQYNINTLYYQANDNFSPPWEGRVEQVTLEGSTDGSNWSLLSNWQFFQSPKRQYVLFPETTVRYLRFLSNSVYENDERTSIAELALRGMEAGSAAVNEADAQGWAIYPNPGSEGFYVEGFSPDNEALIVQDAAGHLLITNAEIRGRFVHAAGWPPGVYLIRRTDGVGGVRRWVKLD